MNQILKRRLSEISTYAGLITVGVAFHVIDITPDQQNAVLGFIGLLLAGTPDKQHDQN